MPPLPNTVPLTYRASATLTDYSGRKRSIGLTTTLSSTDPTPIVDDLIANTTALFTNIGNMSNAAVSAIRWQFERKAEPNCDDLVVYDETYSSVDTVAQFVFRDALGKLLYLDVPAPDAAYFLDDRFTLDLAQLQPGDVRDAALAILQDAAGLDPVFEPCLISTALTSKKGKRLKNSPVPVIEEPGGGDLPPAEPALPEVVP